MKAIFDTVSQKCSQLATQSYSTSFSIGIRLLDPTLRDPIYSIYGFVRFADEIVDTFHNYDQQDLLYNFKQQTFNAISDGISLNPILNSFQHVVRTYNIDHDLIHAFLNSMEMDLLQSNHNIHTFQNYIYGSAEAVGLMCLQVFCDGNKKQYQILKEPARSLGAAFQKVNFLRDLNADLNGLNRVYFPNMNIAHLSETQKMEIQTDIRADFDNALKGIVNLPRGARLGVYVAYVYYKALLRKIERTPAKNLLTQRLSVPSISKLMLLIQSLLRYRLGVIS